MVLDCTPYNQSFTIVFVGILVQKRLLPLAWEIMPQTEKWQEGQWHIVDRLFGRVSTYLHAHSVTLLADRGLTALPLVRRGVRYHWHYVLRMKNEEYCRRRWRTFYRDWQRGCDFLLKKGTSWYGNVGSSHDLGVGSGQAEGKGGSVERAGAPKLLGMWQMP